MMNSDSFFTTRVDVNVDLDKSQVYFGTLNIIIAKYISPAKISVIVPKTVNAKILVRPNFSNYFVMRVNDFEGLPQVCSKYFSKVELSSLNLESNQLLEIIVRPKRIEYDNVQNSHICNIEIA